MADKGASLLISHFNFIYDVFLSFRGDTRYGFTNNLYEALCEKGIKTFRDDPNLRVGDEIRSTLVEAIERSRMSIVVLSEKYASSSWCLDEVAYIMECSDNGRKRRVIPIFYKVETSDVREQKNQYEAGMKKQENKYGRDSNKMKAWRSALTAVADLSGKHYKDGISYESEIIRMIVGEVVELIPPPEPLLIKQQAELYPYIEEVKSQLDDVGSHDTICMLYIYGGDQTEKTKIAGALYNKIFHEFEVACLLENVSTKSKESIKGMEELQRVLLSMIDRKQHIELGSTSRGCSEIKRRLCNKRVLLILDDVDGVQQLELLAGGADWFGAGSRIIVTTSDEDVADKHVVDGFEIKRYCYGEDLEGVVSNVGGMEEGDVVGFDDSLRKVISQLKEGDPRRNVVSIIGMGGLGKTTLARKIYEDNEIKRFFPCRAWSSVSKDFNERKVFEDVLCCLNPSTSKQKNLSGERLKEEVRKCLKTNKKYLVVLDDIWEPEVWDKVGKVFPDDNNGSMILITSRNDHVAHYARSRSPHHQLPPLNAEKSWELFCRKVFGREECPSDLKPIGRSIVQRCGGLPLAIVTIAGLVAENERSYTEWLRIEDLIPLYLAEDKSKVMDVLKVSYDNLPQHLKPCFLYFGIYPEDRLIVASKLIQLWMAEGFIQVPKTRNPPKLEVVGEDYLKKLVDRNLVQVVARRFRDGRVKKCRIHDLLLELCIKESQVEKFMEVCTESLSNPLSNSCRLSFQCRSHKEHSLSLIKGDLSSTHSLFFFARFSSRILKKFPMLHVLHVARFARFFPLEEVPYDWKMINLKYLRIEGYEIINKDIPDWIWSLGNLETLDLSGWKPERRSDLTICIWEMEQLRHIYTGYTIVKLKNSNSKEMRNLQTLGKVLAEPTMLLINKGLFPNLTELHLSLAFSFNLPVCDPISWNLYRLSSLRKLKIDCCCRRVSFDETVFPQNISKITLRSLGVEGGNYNCMSALGQIPNLRVLKLVDVLGGGGVDEFKCGAAGDFLQLQKFYIRMGPSLKSLKIEEGAMPNLQRMVIVDVQHFEIPVQLLALCVFKTYWM